MSKEAAIAVHGIYARQCRFPDWVLTEPAAFDRTVVYYNREDSIEDVHRLMREREPCNIGMRRCYDEDRMEAVFGWRHGAYESGNMPNIAAYCHATVRLSTGFKRVHVLNLIGYAFDSAAQPDYQRFVGKPLDRLVAAYDRVWAKALMCALDLYKAGHIDSLTVYNVGGGAFAGPYGSIFIRQIFEPSFLPIMQTLEHSGIRVRGYDRATKTFTGGFIPNSLETDPELERSLFINAWDPWSLVGNGNERDTSLDGYWGRSSNMAVLCWLPTNPEMRFRSI